MSTWVCYCLVREDSGATYIGATVNIDRRVRQHNGEIKGGATYTTSALKAGHNWKLVCTVGVFHNNIAALQFEWRWKHISRRLKDTPLIRRIKAVTQLLNLERATSKADPYCDHAPLVITIYNRCPETEILFNTPISNGSIVYGNEEVQENIIS